MKRKIILLIFAVFTVFPVVGSHAASEAAAVPRQSPLEELLHSSFIQQAGLVDAKAIQKFYDERDGVFYWHGFFGMTRDADYFIEVLGESWQHGLNPQNYHYLQIKNLRDQGGLLAKARREVLLTDAFVHYVRDMSGMRVRAASLGLDPSDWLQPYTAQQALKFLQEGRNIRGLLRGLPPQSQTYKALQEEFIRLANAPAPAYDAVLPIRVEGLLKPGQRSSAVPALQRRLNSPPLTRDTLLYDDRLAGAVIKFQRDSGLPADGVLGPATLKLLNRTHKDRMLQLVANMERLRWVDDKRPERFVLVNIPSATLWAIDNGAVAFEMPVVVGKSARPTQPFIADIQGVRFNPDWTVPPTIKREDILPKLKEDPTYLTDKGMELIYRGPEGVETVDPADIDWDKITPRDLAALDMVQIPGVHNPLGRFRILMPNQYNIYLHDTNQPEYFDKIQRAQSSGCIRMKEPEKMARFVMMGQEGWNDEKMQAILASGRTQDVRITNTIPVYILYYSAWSDEYGRVVFGNDIYGFDEDLIAQLSAIDGFDLRDHNDYSLAGIGPSTLASAE